MSSSPSSPVPVGTAAVDGLVARTPAAVPAAVSLRATCDVLADRAPRRGAKSRQ